MSEGSKMGLFGSKDENKEQKKESSKGNSTDRYAPYCIDSDTETYDTEALSMMDINDIIGVQSEPVSDSTLESEIAALSQIIRESKAETSESLTSSMETEDIEKTDGVACEEGFLVDKGEVDESKETSEFVTVCGDQEAIKTLNDKLLVQFTDILGSNKSQETMKCDLENLTNDLEPNVSLNTVTKVESKESCENQRASDAMVSQIKKSPVTIASAIPEISFSNVEDAAKQESSPESETSNINKDLIEESRTIIRVSGISDSLQLIGEAYISEDSQETSTNDNEHKDLLDILECDSVIEEKPADDVDESRINVQVISECINTPEVQPVEDTSNIEKESKLQNAQEASKSNDPPPLETEDCEETRNITTTEISETVQLSSEKEISTQNCGDVNSEDQVNEAVIQESCEVIQEAVCETIEEISETSTVVKIVPKELITEVIQKQEEVNEMQSGLFPSLNEADKRETVKEIKVHSDNEKPEEKSPRVTPEIIEAQEINCSETESHVDSMECEDISLKIQEETEISENVVQNEMECTETVLPTPSLTKMESPAIDKGKVEESETKVSPDVINEANDSQYTEVIAENLEINEEPEIPVLTPENIVSIVEEDGPPRLIIDSINNTKNIENNSSIQGPMCSSPKEGGVSKSIIVEDEEEEEAPPILEKEGNHENFINDKVINNVPEKIVINEISEDTHMEVDVKTKENELEPIIESTVTLEKNDENCPATLDSVSIVNENLTTFENEDISKNEVEEITDKLSDSESITIENEQSSSDQLSTPEVEENNEDISNAGETSFIENTSNSLELNTMKNVMNIEASDNAVQDTEKEELLEIIEVENLADELESSLEQEDLMPQKECEEVETSFQTVNNEEIPDEESEKVSETAEVIPVDSEQTGGDISLNKIEEAIKDDDIQLSETDNVTKEKLQPDSDDDFQQIPVKIIEKSLVASPLEEDHREDEDVPMETMVETEEEGMEEEMNLTLEPDESELQAETISNDTEKIHQQSEDTESNKDTDEREENISQSTEDKIESTTKESEDENLKETSSSSNTDTYMLEKNDDELMDKQNLGNNLKNEAEDSTLKNILDGTNNMGEMFSEEQCQNTQDIVTSILDNVRNVTDFKNILGTDGGVENEIDEVLEQSANLPLGEAEIEELAQKLPQGSEDILNKDMEDPMSAQNIDSLEGLLGLDLMPENEDTALKPEKQEEETQEQETIDKDVDMELLLQQPNRTSDITQEADYITDVISSCLTNTSDVPLQASEEKPEMEEAIGEKSAESKNEELLKLDDNIIVESMSKDTEESDVQKLEVEDNDLDMEFEENPLESVGDLEEAEPKLQLSQDILLESTDPTEDDAPTAIETSQPSSEISELESAVKFLQESEEQAIDSPLVLSPKMVDSVVEDISNQANAGLFVPDEDICEDTSELVAELQGINPDSISISEAEIISEAAKLESERKLAEEIKMNASIRNFEKNDLALDAERMEQITESSEGPPDICTPVDTIENTGIRKSDKEIDESMPPVIPRITETILKTSEPIPKVSILEERLKEPPKIEIPIAEVAKVCESPITPKDNLLIQKDAKVIAYQRMLESPKLSDKNEPRIVDTPRKDSEKHDFENVGSPRIILKIAKSAIADCGEPRSPKSPKIRSATNSPNPEDSPGQKLGKIKLKLSKGGHPSIISNENIEEITAQWHTEGSASLSPIGMKIKLSKSGDASIVPSEKYEEELKETKHKFEEPKRTESPIGMKIKLSKSGDASIVQQDAKDIIKHKEKLDILQGSPKRTESPIGMKIKLSKTGDASIIQPDRQEFSEEKESSKSKDRLELSYDSPKRTDSPIGMKIKLSKTGDASIISPDLEENKDSTLKLKEKMESSPEIPKRTESPIGMKIKLSKTKGGASIIPLENSEEIKDKLEIPDAPKRTESPLGMKIKLSKTGDASIIHTEVTEESKEIKYKEKIDAQDIARRSESPGLKIKVSKSDIATESMEDCENAQEPSQRSEVPIGMKIKLSKSGDASIISCDKQEQLEEHRSWESHQEPKRTESPIGMKIKLSKTGDASIIQSDIPEDTTSKGTRTPESESSKSNDPSLGMKIKLLKSGDASIIESEKKEKQQRRRDTESPLEMKIKLSKTGHPTIIPCDTHAESTHKSKDSLESSHNLVHRYKDQVLHKEPALKILKSGHSTILQSNRAELTIEPIQAQNKKMDKSIEISPKRKDITISPIESKKCKLETQLSQILPEVTIQPVMSRDQKQLLFDPKTSLISRQQMNVISQEISITQVRPTKPADTTMSEKLKDILCKNVTSSPIGSDCEIIEHRPELIIVNENSNSSQDVVIIEEVPANRASDVKAPKKRGRPRRNPLPPQIIHPQTQMIIPRDPLALDEIPQVVQYEPRENERPKRTCRNQKSYAPPKRGRGRGRGKRKLEGMDLQPGKKSRVDQDLNAIEASTMAVITIDESSTQQDSMKKSSELYKALKQPPMDRKAINPMSKVEKQIVMSGRKKTRKKTVASKVSDSTMPKPLGGPLDSKDAEKNSSDKKADGKSENKDILVPPGHANWLTPSSKRQAEGRNETVSTVQVIDEETRMSAESGSRSQTPARNISVPASETIVNEESQGSVLSTATTESEKVKVKNRRMEINFDPDEGPFTVDKIAEYEWPLDRKGETFMIQEQISQYLGVKSFKRKYPDLKRRMVDMEERNYLRENGLVSEAMCDMGLTAVCSSEVLDVMCSDFPDQYEEYRKHMREKQVKEHSKKQKELTAAANAERNRIDLAEMAIQSALSWNISLNKARRETRKCSLDLQTFTIHVPKKPQKLDLERKISHYPVALIPGQYTDYYREYTPAELRYYPLNTVLYGPMRPNERKFDSQSEGSQSDSDSDSTSDDSSSSSSEGTQDTEGSQSTMDDVDMEIVTQKEEIKLKCKMCLKTLNKHSKNEVLIQCGTCNGNVHPSCIDLPLDMVPHIQSYAWQCTDCKTCAQCHDPADEDKMLFCDMCDRGYHIYCVGLRRVPQGRWHCQECAVCANCGSREPGGANSDRNSVAQWQHEFKKGDKNTRVYVSTLCVPCSKLWRKGRYCPHCSRCHTAPRLDLEANLVHCSACDKYLHLGCVETKGVVLDKKNYLCDFCAPNRQQQQVVKPLVSKMFKA